MSGVGGGDPPARPLDGQNVGHADPTVVVSAEEPEQSPSTSAPDQPPEAPTPKLVHYFLTDGPAHRLVSALIIFLVSLAAIYASTLVLTSGYTIGCVPKYCYKQPAWAEYAFGPADEVCVDAPPRFTLFRWERTFDCGLVKRTRVILVPAIDWVNSWFGSHGRFQDVPLTKGFGRWFEIFGLGYPTSHTELVVDVWAAKWVLLGGTSVCVWFVWTYQRLLQVTASWWEWVLSGDKVVGGNLATVVDHAALQHTVDPELLYHLVLNVAFKPRDTRTSANLISQGRAWCNAHRKDWPERSVTTQVVEAATVAMTITAPEEAAYYHWGAGSIWRGLTRAKGVVGGLLKWNRQLAT